MIMSREDSLCDAVTHGTTKDANDILSPHVGGSKRYLDEIEGIYSMKYYCCASLLYFTLMTLQKKYPIKMNWTGDYYLRMILE